MKQYIEPKTEVVFVDTEGALCKMSIHEEEAGPVGAPKQTQIESDDSEENDDF